MIAMSSQLSCCDWSIIHASASPRFPACDRIRTITTSAKPTTTITIIKQQEQEQEQQGIGVDIIGRATPETLSVALCSSGPDLRIPTQAFSDNHANPIVDEVTYTVYKVSIYTMSCPFHSSTSPLHPPFLTSYECCDDQRQKGPTQATYLYVPIPVRYIRYIGQDACVTSVRDRVR